MTVITISEQLGSDGMRVASQVAQTLGYHVADKDVMEAVLRQYGLVEFEELDEPPPSFWLLFDWDLVLAADMLDRTIKALAHHGNIIIIGRGGYAALRGLPDVLNVRIQAPRSLRIQRVMEQRRISLPQAEAAVAREDRVHAGFIEKVHNVRSDDVSVFDMVLDTGNITPDVAANLVVEAAQAITQRPPGHAPTAAKLEVSHTLARVVCDVLGCEEISHEEAVTVG
jgi:cytidylate kinase